ncbi:MAG TPA: class I SAM-dependent methyltransferase [Polyangiaceae bacterium]|nr:class I SAM-dependent methyltransferase [Polyangiaceae bacterium]
MTTQTPYFSNHDRRQRFPWSLYHRELERRLAGAVRALKPARPKVLVVGCGLEPFVPGVEGPRYFGADLDPASIARCRELYPELSDRLAPCPSPYELPTGGAFDANFDAIVAKEVVEHLLEPERWLAGLAARLEDGGELLITTPNYGSFSTLPLLEATVLELFARRDGYSRKHIHPSRFTRERLAQLSIPGLQRFEVHTTRIGWALFARARKSCS